MSQASSKQPAKATASVSPASGALVVSDAYAIVPDPKRPGYYFPVHLENVLYDKLNHLEPSQRSEPIGTCDARVTTAILVRSRGRKWK